MMKLSEPLPVLQKKTGGPCRRNRVRVVAQTCRADEIVGNNLLSRREKPAKSRVSVWLRFCCCEWEVGAPPPQTRLLCKRTISSYSACNWLTFTDVEINDHIKKKKSNPLIQPRKAKSSCRMRVTWEQTESLESCLLWAPSVKDNREAVRAACKTTGGSRRACLSGYCAKDVHCIQRGRDYKSDSV